MSMGGALGSPTVPADPLELDEVVVAGSDALELLVFVEASVADEDPAEDVVSLAVDDDEAPLSGAVDVDVFGTVVESGVDVAGTVVDAPSDVGVVDVVAVGSVVV